MPSQTDTHGDRSTLIIVALFLLALGLRLGLWFELRGHPTYVAPVGDMQGNHEFAVQVVQGTLPPNTYYKAPLYSYFLAAIYWIGGVNLTRARIIQIVLTSLSPVLTFLIARELFDRRVGVIAGVLASVYWVFLFFSTELLDTALACLLYLLLAWLLLALDDRRWSKWLVCGFVLGLGAITRPNILVFAPVLALVVFIVSWRGRAGGARGTGQVPSIHGLPETQPDSGGGTATERAAVKGPVPSGDQDRSGSAMPPAPKTRALTREPRTPNPEPWLAGWRAALARVVALTIGTCAAVLPVTLRNRIVGGEWVLIGAYGGLNLYVANNPDSDSKDGPLLIDDRFFTVPLRMDPNAREPWARNCFNYLLGMRVAESRLGRVPKPGEFATILAGMAKDFIRENPGWFARHALRRLCWLFNRYEFQSNRDLQEFSDNWGVLRPTRLLHFGIVCPFALVGLVLALSRRELRKTAFLYYVALLASLALPAVLFIINSRFRAPLVQLLVPFAAFGFVQVLGLFQPEVSWTRRGLVLGTLAGLAVFCNANLFDYWSHRRSHLQAMYLEACYRAGRQDLADRALDELEATFGEEMKDPRPSNVSLMVQYGCRGTQMFLRYLWRGDYQKALKWGWIMLRQEPIVPEAVNLFTAMVMEREGRQRCVEALALTRSRCETDHPEILAGCLLRFGRRYGDVPALEEAVRLHKILIGRRPADLSLQEGLARGQAILASLIPTSRTGSAPASLPVDREASK
jgi:hypothetical protein